MIQDAFMIKACPSFLYQRFELLPLVPSCLLLHLREGLGPFDLFSLAVLNDKKVPTPLEDAVANMKVLEAIVQSADKENWGMP
jgi:hypothetical protein